MTSAFGKSWLSGGKLRAKFKGSARPGDTLTITGTIFCIEQKSDVSYANCNFEVRSQKDETIVTGETIVRLSSGKE
jgi:acyl-CoA thioesterase FadM